MNQPLPPTRLEFDAITAAQAEYDLTIALARIQAHRATTDDADTEPPVRLHLVLDLNPPQPKED